MQGKWEHMRGVGPTSEEPVVFVHFLHRMGRSVKSQNAILKLEAKGMRKKIKSVKTSEEFTEVDVFFCHFIHFLSYVLVIGDHF